MAAIEPEVNVFSKYTANIKHSGQCRHNLKTWRGVWTLYLNDDPSEFDPELEEDEGKIFPRIVICHRKQPHDTFENRWYGKEVSMMSCGALTFLNVEWENMDKNISSKTDISFHSNNETSSDDLSLISDYTILVCENYFMLGYVGNAVDSSDDCIRLDIAK